MAVIPNLAHEQRPEWKGVKLDQNFWSDFSILGGHILVSTPAGYATLPGVQKSVQLNHEVRRAGMAENDPYIHIFDNSRLDGTSPEARRFFIETMPQWDNLLAMIFCGLSPMMRLGINLGRRIYTVPFDIHTTDSLADAVNMALTLLDRKNIPVKQTDPPDAPADDCPSTRCEDHWMFQTDDFSMRFQIIDDDILQPIPMGIPQKIHVDQLFSLQQEVFSQSGLQAGAYYLLSDLAGMKNADMDTRRYFVKRLREWHHRYPLRMLIFYHANWVMRAAINLSKVTAPYTVHVVDSLGDALSLIQTHRSLNHTTEPEKTDTEERWEGPSGKYLAELLDILAGISWESQSPESILQKTDPAHPFRQIVEAVSLIKMDVDHALAEKERSEKTLRETSGRYKAILDNIQDGYYEVDLAGNLTFFNPSLPAILGYSEAELKGMNYRGFCGEEYVAAIFKTFNTVFRTGLPARAMDWKLSRKDGKHCHIEASVSLIKDNAEEPIGFRGICRDITQRVTAEQEKLKIMDRLRQAQKMEAIGLLAGGVAHDLNNILSGLVSYPDLLLMKLPTDSPLRKPLETIKKSGERAAAIVSDLLTLARKGIQSQTIINLNAVITDYLNSPEHQDQLARHPLVRITTALDGQLLNMEASPIHMVKILMNLVANAAEAMPDGGEILISTENFYLDTPLPDFPALKQGAHVLLTVKDHGIGISNEDKGRIFEPFYTKKALGRSGTGLGMALVWGAVQDHDGAIDVQSAPGQGTTIRIFLPASRAGGIDIPAEIEVNNFRGKGETVLVVDDLEDQRNLAADILTQLGYVVQTAAGGEAAVDFLKKQPADLVILDMIMHPGMDGLDTFREILRFRPRQKALIATGFSTSERIQSAQALGAGKCIKKPYVVTEIARAVREELDR